MSDSPEVDQLKERIAHTREELGETVEALAAKADVKARASGAVHDAVDSAKAKVQGLADSARETVAGAKDKVTGAKDTALEKAADAKDTAKDKAVDAKDTAKEKVAVAKEKVTGVKDRVVDAKDKVAEVGTRRWAQPGVDTGDPLDPEGALVVVEERPAGLDRRLQAALFATAVGAVLGAVIVWVRARRRS